jgi:hypothetical protein
MAMFDEVPALLLARETFEAESGPDIIEALSEKGFCSKCTGAAECVELSDLSDF